MLTGGGARFFIGHGMMHIIPELLPRRDAKMLHTTTHRRLEMSVIIKDIPKSNNEIIRIEVSEFKGMDLINIRIWYQAFDAGGNMVYKPTQKGVAINVSQYEELRDGIEKINNYLQDKKSGATPQE